MTFDIPPPINNDNVLGDIKNLESLDYEFLKTQSIEMYKNLSMEDKKIKFFIHKFNFFLDTKILPERFSTPQIYSGFLQFWDHGESIEEFENYIIKLESKPQNLIYYHIKKQWDDDDSRKFWEAMYLVLKDYQKIRSGSDSI